MLVFLFFSIIIIKVLYSTPSIFLYSSRTFLSVITFKALRLARRLEKKINYFFITLEYNYFTWRINCYYQQKIPLETIKRAVRVYKPHYRLETHIFFVDSAILIIPSLKTLNWSNACFARLYTYIYTNRPIKIITIFNTYIGILHHNIAYCSSFVRLYFDRLQRQSLHRSLQ